MATKTISIDLEAYRRLKSVQNENESFSQTIKRVVRKPVTTDELVKMFDDLGKSLGEEGLQAIEDAVAWRQNPYDRERMDGLLGHNRRDRSHRPQRTSKKNGRLGKAKAA